jgi:uncharacterized membrane protein YhaH (DUF805 family)
LGKIREVAASVTTPASSANRPALNPSAAPGLNTPGLIVAPLQLAPTKAGTMFAAYRNYWDFHGRAARSEYWLFFLWGVILGVVAGIVDVLAFRHVGQATLFGPCALFCAFANLIPNLSLSFRRLHDINRSAWWLLIAFVPLLGGLALFVFTLLRGTPGENRFGPEPGQRSYEELEATFA